MKKYSGKTFMHAHNNAHATFMHVQLLATYTSYTFLARFAVF